ncbi:hypothetical protein NL676_008842 [Syzygium grande]|nr:hypothetical protein NL676_008842 [Syzygium grande]
MHETGDSSWEKGCKVIVQALEDHGCFIVDHPNVPLGLHDSVFSVTEDLFDLPHETKIKNTNLKPSHGYIPKVPGTPLLEGMNIDGAEKLELCKKFTSIMRPSGNDHFRKTVHDYGKFIAEIEKVVLDGLRELWCREMLGPLDRVLHYKKPADLDVNVNPIAHTDKSFLSYLHQNNIRGLEVRTKDGEWFTFEPSASTFMVMAGDACVAWSNGRIKACYHRVAVREESQVRYSLRTFLYVSGMIETPEEFIDEAHPRQYKPFNHIDFLCYYDSSDNRIKAESLIKTYSGVRAN